MTTFPNSTGSAGGSSPRFGVGVFQLIVVLTIVLYLLASSMVGHRFFRGGHPHRGVDLATHTPLP
jgi:hypothetical protein